MKRAPLLVALLLLLVLLSPRARAVVIEEAIVSPERDAISLGWSTGYLYSDGFIVERAVLPYEGAERNYEYQDWVFADGGSFYWWVDENVTPDTRYAYRVVEVEGVYIVGWDEIDVFTTAVAVHLDIDSDNNNGSSRKLVLEGRFLARSGA